MKGNVWFDRYCFDLLLLKGISIVSLKFVYKLTRSFLTLKCVYSLSFDENWKTSGNVSSVRIRCLMEAMPQNRQVILRECIFLHND